MKNVLIITSITVVVFTLTTFITAREEAPVDGDDRYGFPLNFYIRWGGKRFLSPEKLSEFSYFNLSVDIIVAAVISIALYFMARKIIKR